MSDTDYTARMMKTHQLQVTCPKCGNVVCILSWPTPLPPEVGVFGPMLMKTCLCVVGIVFAAVQEAEACTVRRENVPDEVKARILVVPAPANHNYLTAGFAAGSYRDALPVGGPTPALDTSVTEEMWANAPYEDSESWHGPFATRELAVRDGMTEYGGYESFVVSRAAWVDFAPGVPDAETIGDIIESWMTDEHPGLEDADRLRRAITDGAPELDAFLKAWTRKHLTRVYFTATVDVETITRIGLVEP